MTKSRRLCLRSAAGWRTVSVVAPFDRPVYLLFNLAVGGNYPGSPSAATVFPVTMEVEYVRVYSGGP